MIRVDTAAEAIGATHALLAGGLHGIEITYTIPGATEVIAQLESSRRSALVRGWRSCRDGEANPNMILGAGTVLTASQARAAIDAGARFLVSPALIPEVIEVARERDIAMLPGAFTPTEIQRAHSLGGDIIKVFPASHFGPRYFKELKGPFPSIPLMPAGGIDASNAGDWFRAGAVALGAGGKIVDRAAIKAGDWATLTRRARELMDAVQQARAAE